MTLRNAIQEFRQLRGRSNRRSKRRLYSNFIQLLESLEFKALSFEEMRSLERKLADLLYLFFSFRKLLLKIFFMAIKILYTPYASQHK